MNSTQYLFDVRVEYDNKLLLCWLLLGSKNAVIFNINVVGNMFLSDDFEYDLSEILSEILR